MEVQNIIIVYICVALLILELLHLRLTSHFILHLVPTQAVVENGK